jgi:hypothetical protein
MKIGEKEYSDEELTQLVTQHEELSSQFEKAKPVFELAERYGVSPEQFASEAQGAFGALINLQEAGILDKDGRIVETAVEKRPTSPPSDLPKSVAQPIVNVDQIAEAALQKLNPKIEALATENKTLRDSLNRLYREKIAETVKAKGYQVDDEDVNLALASASRTGKDFWEELDSRAERYKTTEQRAIERFAKEHNLDIGELNKRREMHSKEGSMGQMITEGKRITSRPKRGANEISPLEATEQLFRMRGLGK